MSERYGGPPPTAVLMVCTDRGSHERVILADVVVYTHSGLVELGDRYLLPRAKPQPRGLDFFGPSVKAQRAAGNRVRHVRVPRTGEQDITALHAVAAWEFDCPQCTATPRIRRDKIADAVKAGLPEIDVSLI